MAEKARAWQYVNLAELLPGKPYNVEDELSLLEQVQAEGKVVLVRSVEQLKRSRKEVVDIVSWVEAFGTLMAVVAPTEPAAIPHMVAHMLRASGIRGSRWIDFDKEYRIKAAAQGSYRWSVHYGELWDYYIMAAATAHAQSNVPALKGWGNKQISISPELRGPPREGQRHRTHWHGEKEYATHTILMGHVFTHICYGRGAEGHMSLECPERKKPPQGKQSCTRTDC